MNPSSLLLKHEIIRLERIQQNGRTASIESETQPDRMQTERPGLVTSPCCDPGRLQKKLLEPLGRKTRDSQGLGETDFPLTGIMAQNELHQGEIEGRSLLQHP